MYTDATFDAHNEPWLTARDIIAEHHSEAETFVTRLISELASAGNQEDAVLLFDVLRAIETMRMRTGTSLRVVGDGRLVPIAWPATQ